jgi:hypothetical protein
MAKSIKGELLRVAHPSHQAANLGANRRFTLDWVCLNQLSFDAIKHVPAHLGKSRLAVAVMDGQEICAEAGYEFLRAYSQRDRESPCLLERGWVEDVDM